MTISPVLLVPVEFVNSGPRLGPVRLLGVPGSNVLCQAGNQRTGWKKRQPEIEQGMDIRFNERLGLHYSQELSRQHCLTVMADTGSLTRQIKRKTRISRSNHRPGVNKDLCANLFRDCFSIERDRPASRRRLTMLETQKGGVLCRVTEPSPPQDCSVL